ncbi:MAG: hypothetical protein ACC742_08415 [Thermoanaerobaculales bacterium]
MVRRGARQAAGKAFAWLEANRGNFRISRERTDIMPWRVKPIGELIFLLTVLKGYGLRLRVLDELTRFALEEAATFDWQELAAFDPSAATPLAFIADFYALENRPAPFDMEYFEFLRKTEFFEGIDRLPYREMDVAYCYSRLGIPDQQGKLKMWFASTTFGRRQHLARYTIDDIYSLTHAIFYLTDVGLQPVAGTLDGVTVHRLQRELVALTAIMMRADNIDVLGELLLCWIFCGLAPTAFETTVFAAGLERVLAFASVEGAVAPRHRVRERANAAEATFGELYHTTLVAALLFSLAARRKI